jgi:hypothetical protein
LETNLIIHLQAIIPKMSAAKKPQHNGNREMPDSAVENPPFNKSKTASPNMGMITIRKEKRATLALLFPSINPVEMVVPERDNPGNTAIACEIPMMKASLNDIVAFSFGLK